MLVMSLGYKAEVAHLAFAPDGRALAAASPRGVFLWRAITDGAHAEWLTRTYNANTVQFTPDGRWLFANTSALWRVDLVTGTCSGLPTSDALIMRFDVSPTGAHVLVSPAVPSPAGLRTRLALWRTDDVSLAGKVWELPPAPYSYLTPRFLADGTRFARYESVDGLYGARPTHRVVFCDSATGAVLSEAGAGPEMPYEWLLAPDGDRFAARGTNQIAVHRFPADEGRSVVFRSDGRRHFTAMALHPSGRFLAAANNDSTVKLLDTATGTEARTFTWKLDRMRSVCFSPDGTLAAAGTDKGQVVVWDVDL